MHLQGEFRSKFSVNIIILFLLNTVDAYAKKRRDKEEIMYQILSAAKEPVTRTRLIYASFLSNSELRQYIALLLEHEMLEVDPITKTKLSYRGRRKVS